MNLSSLGLRQKSFQTLTETESAKVKKLTIINGSLKPILEEYEDSKDKCKKGILSKYDLKKMNKTIGLIGSKKTLKAWYLVGKDDYYPYSKKTGFIYVYVRRNIRKKGLATKIFYKAVREAAKKGYSRIMVYPHDPKSHKFFNRPEIRQYCKDRNIQLRII